MASITALCQDLQEISARALLSCGRGPGRNIHLPRKSCLKLFRMGVECNRNCYTRCYTLGAVLVVEAAAFGGLAQLVRASES